jgi:putative oxidoreductase
MKSLFQLSFLPRSADLALLLLRVWIGLTLLINHGWSKLMHFSAMAGKMPDPLHVGGTGNMVLIVLAEVLCPVLLVLGLASRLAALIIAIEMGVAFFLVHHAALAAGPGSGELAFLYLAASLAIFFGGAGKFAVDGA